jgi:peptidoglycan-associated lipoprotein
LESDHIKRKLLKIVCSDVLFKPQNIFFKNFNDHCVLPTPGSLVASTPRGVFVLWDMKMNRSCLLSLVSSMAVLLGACSNVCKVETDGSGGAFSPGSPADFAANVPDCIYFEFDRFDILQSAKKRLAAQCDWLKNFSSESVTVSGHTDCRGTADYNMSLGAARATAVKDFLVKRGGIDSSRIRVVSYGKERLVNLGNDEEAHAENRRAVTVVDPR